ncbi:MAG: N-acetylmuramoyl-L-alanine amidase [Oscillospiraceae bacterium]|jgi:N-acetylmuramoyl-L-alanine amidase|nr:N-acetylmuramoyl-L-alanine amidase [Oscillospiraceae bacterium]
MLMVRIKYRYIVIPALFLFVLLVALIPTPDRILESGTSEVIITTPKPIIIVDAGHGGVDGGAVGVKGTVEKGINLTIALKLRDTLTEMGFTVVMTRETDISIHDSDANTIRQQKTSDLKNRLELTKIYPESILISIHQNTISKSSVRGAQVFHSPNNEESNQLANDIQSFFNENIQPERHKAIKAAQKNLYLFYNAKNVAVLCECGFLSNAEEEAMLNTDEHQNLIVKSIVDGLEVFLSRVQPR